MDVVDSPELKLYVCVKCLILVPLARRTVCHGVDLTDVNIISNQLHYTPQRVSLISQLPKLCVKISILMHRHMRVHSFSTRLTSVTFAEDKVLIFLILRKDAKIVQL